MKLTAVETENMRAFGATARNLKTKEAGLPGLALVHGPRGMGKSFAAKRYHAMDQDSIYLLPDPDWDTRWLKETLCVELGLTPPRGLKAKHDEVIASLAVHPRLIMIDECNVLSPRVLDAVRLLAEWTDTPVLLIGHERIVTKLERMGPLVDRLLYITKFAPLGFNDLRALAEKCLELPMEDEALETVLKSGARGRIRPSLVAMKRMEDRARDAGSGAIKAEHFRASDIKAAVIGDRREQ